MRLVRVVVAVAAGVAVLAGCSDGGTANETLPSASSTAAEPSETLPPLGPPDLPMPVEARQQTAAGAEAFVRYYMTLYTAAQESMDPTYMDQFSQGCTLCDALIHNIREDAAAGYKYEGGQALVKAASFAETADSKTEGAFSIDQDALTVRAADQTELVELSAPRASLDCGAILTWSSDDSSWIFTQWDVN